MQGQVNSDLSGVDGDGLPDDEVREFDVRVRCTLEKVSARFRVEHGDFVGRRPFGDKVR